MASQKNTTLKGGQRIALHTHLPMKTCARCGLKLQAAEFLKTWTVVNHEHRLQFQDTCQICVPPPRKFPDLHGARFDATFVGDNGRIVTWRERDKGGKFGPHRSLSELGIRLCGTVFRPQPKIVRTSGPTRHIVQRRTGIKDARRRFSKAEVSKAVERQRGLCAVCGCLFTSERPATGDHIRPHADGYPTSPENCIAVHGNCNSIKGRRPLKHAQQRVALQRQGVLL